MSDYNNEFNRGYDDPTYKGSYDARAASEGRYARARDEARHEEAMARNRLDLDALTNSSTGWVGGTSSQNGGHRRGFWHWVGQAYWFFSVFAFFVCLVVYIVMIVFDLR